ncbi:Photosystem II PsbX [Quillaja saponaria]|uniref:Photosystem II PsbX n=1 Tax=Quillaja saponaria TaxID=32244 RepID=A0AAD7LHQ8_QUISA|nr:Photosystem II PsbX [Quillaja saponaria]
MASVSMTLLLSSATQNRLNQQPSTEAFFRAIPIRQSKKIVVAKTKSQSKLEINASLKEKAVTAITAAALTASMVIPDVAEAAEYGFSPSLKNFLLSIAAGGIVLGAIFGAVIGVSNFDPVKRT